MDMIWIMLDLLTSIIILLSLMLMIFFNPFSKIWNNSVYLNPFIILGFGFGSKKNKGKKNGGMGMMFDDDDDFFGGGFGGFGGGFGKMGFGGNMGGFGDMDGGFGGGFSGNTVF